MRGLAILLLCTASVRAVEPRAQPSDYPAHTEAGDVVFAAEFTLHSFGGAEQQQVAEDFLTFDVALYPKPGTRLDVSLARFALRLNHRKESIQPVAPGVVASALKYPPAARGPKLTARSGDATLVYGQERRVGRFPDDARPAQSRFPLPRAPEPVDRSGAEPRPAPRPEEVVAESALPDGPARGPVGGYLFFPSREKPSRIRSIELLFDGVVLKLR